MKLLVILLILGYGAGENTQNTAEGGGNLGKNKTPNRPHILMILADDMGYQDVGFRGSDIQTPNLDRLATEGVILENHYVMPQCSPTRSSLMSGRYAIRTGFWEGNIKPKQEWGLRLNETTMPEMLRRNGYATHGIGKWHCGLYTWEHTPARRGFDSYLGLYLGAQGYFSHKNRGSLDLREDYFDENGTFVDKMLTDLDGVYNTGIFTNRAISIIEQHDAEQPLFLYLSYTSPHTPLQAPEEDVARFASHMTNSTDNRKKYATMVSLMDEGIGAVVDTLEQYNMRDNTLIVFSSDNGAVYGRGATGSNYPLRGGKLSLFEGGVRAVSFVNSPLLKKTGYVNTHLHHVTDWYATFQRLARDTTDQETKPQLPIDGVNIWRSISQNKSSGREEVLMNMRDFSMLNNNSDSEFLLSDYGEGTLRFLVEYNTDILDSKSNDFFVIRWKDWKLFYGTYIEQGWSKKNGLKELVGGKYSGVEGTGSGIKLFDLSSDPREETNVADLNPTVVTKILDKIPGYRAKMTRINKRTSSEAGRAGGEWYPWVENEL